MWKYKTLIQSICCKLVVLFLYVRKKPIFPLVSSKYKYSIIFLFFFFFWKYNIIYYNLNFIIELYFSICWIRSIGHFHHKWLIYKLRHVFADLRISLYPTSHFSICLYNKKTLMTSSQSNKQEVKLPQFRNLHH